MEKNSMRCTHPTNEIKTDYLSHSFCTKCGIIFDLNSPSQSRALIKPIKLEQRTDTDPFIYLKSIDHYLETHKLTLHSQWYLTNRHKCIIFLKSLCGKYRTTDKTFFSALRYLDNIMSYYQEPMDQKQFDLKVISCFILAGKFSENDSYPFDLNHFTSVNEKYLFNSSSLRIAEIETLKQLEYNLNDITPYEYLMTLLNCGIVLENELSDEEDIVNLYLLCLKILTKIILSDVFLQFNAFQIAFSIVYLARGHFGVSKKNMGVINQLFNVLYIEYVDCVEYLNNLFNKNKKNVFNNREDSIEKIKSNLSKLPKPKSNSNSNPLSKPPRKIQDIKVVVRTKLRTNSLSTQWDSQGTVNGIENDTHDSNSNSNFYKSNNNSNKNHSKTDIITIHLNSKIDNINRRSNNKSISVTRKFISEAKIRMLCHQCN